MTKDHDQTLDSERASATPVRSRHRSPSSGSRVCSYCGSADLRTLSVVHQGGLATEHGHATVTGAGVGSDGDLLIGGGSAETWATRQTALSKRAAPPDKKSGASDAGMGVGCVSVLAIVAIVGFFAGAEAIGSGLVLWMGIGLVIAIVAGMRAKSRDDEWNAREWPKLHKKWQESVMCMRCGEITSP